MSYFLEIFLALATLALPDLGWASERSYPWAVAALVLAPYALGWCTRRVTVAGRFRLGALLERLLAFSPIALQAVALGSLGWSAFLAERGVTVTTLDGWVGLELMYVLAPYLVYQVAAIDARARSLAFAPDTPGRLRSFQLRMFLSAFLLVLAFLAGSSLLARSPTWKVRLEEVGLLGGVMAVLLLVLFLRFMPFFLRYAWDTSPLEPGWARTVLEQVARSVGFAYRELLVWRTGNQMSNAAVVGLTDRSRLVFFSDLLLQQLGPRELAAVFAHEMGHARRAHSLVFGAFALGFFLAARQIIVRSGIDGPWEGAALLLAILGLWYLAFGYLSRRFELEADLESLRVVGESAPLIHALELVTSFHANRSSWRHFSTRQRAEFLRAAEADPLVGIRLKLKLARWRKLGFALFAVATLLQLQDLAKSWDEDWLRADLRLGRYEAALARAGSEGVAPELAALAQRAASAPLQSREPKALLSAVLAALTRGDREAAQDWLDLASLRSGQSPESLIESLQSDGKDLPESLRAALRELSVR